MLDAHENYIRLIIFYQGKVELNLVAISVDMWKFLTWGAYSLREKFVLMMENENLGLIKEIATFLENAFELCEKSSC